jgi:preprotein translocase subunit SecE
VEKVLGYINEVRGELSKVVWPKRQEVIKLTLVVFSISGIVAIYVGGWDFIFTKALEIIFAR